MGLPTRQSLVTSVPYKYCFIRLGSVRASHTLDTGVLIVVVASAVNLSVIFFSFAVNFIPQVILELCYEFLIFNLMKILQSCTRSLILMVFPFALTKVPFTCYV